MASTQEALQRARDAQKKAQDLAFQEAQRLAGEQKGTVEQQASSMAQEAFVGKKQQERTLPNVMAQSGLAGQGYTETTANAINTSYQKAWNEIMKSKASSLSSINSNLMGEQSKINQNKLGIDADYETNLANYLAQQAKASASSGSTGSTKTTTEKTNPVTGSAFKGNAEAQALESLRNFTFDPYNPVVSKTKMYEYLAPFLTDKNYKLSASQIEKIIDEYIARYAVKPNTPYKDSVSRAKPLYDL